MQNRNQKSEPVQELSIINSAQWMLLLGLILIILGAIIWGFFGSFVVDVEGRGIFIRKKGNFSLQTMADGLVGKIYVQPGSRVEKGDIIVEISDPTEELQLRTAEIKVSRLEEDLNQLADAIAREAEAVKIGLEQELAAKEYTIQQMEENIVALNQDLTKKKELLRQGLVSGSVVREQEKTLTQANIELAVTKAAVATLKGNLLKGYRSEEIKEKEQALLRETEARDILRTNREYAKVVSPGAGIVLEIFVSQGARVTPGQAIAWIETPPSEDNPLVVHGYFPLALGKVIKIGLPVNIVSSSGTTQGIVSEVSQYAASQENLMRLYHSPSIEQYLTNKADAVIFTLIEPEPSFLLDQMSTGTVANLHVVTERIRPIYFILPLNIFKYE